MQKKVRRDERNPAERSEGRGEVGWSRPGCGCIAVAQQAACSFFQLRHSWQSLFLIWPALFFVFRNVFLHLLVVVLQQCSLLLSSAFPFSDVKRRHRTLQPATVDDEKIWAAVAVFFCVVPEKPSLRRHRVLVFVVGLDTGRAFHSNLAFANQ